MNDKLLDLLEYTTFQLTEISDTLKTLSDSFEQEHIEQHVISSLNLLAHGVNDIKNELNKNLQRFSAVSPETPTLTESDQ